MSPEYENLINSLIEDGYLKTPAIIEAFKLFDRTGFVPFECQGEACVNAPLSIGYGQTISQPLVVAFMIELLDPKKSEKILEVGSGSGWQTAILASIVSQNGNPDLGKVIAIERIPELKEMTEKHIGKSGFLEKGIVKLYIEDGSKGYKPEAPYDKIIAGAASAGDVPQEWKKQLKIGGKIVAPVDQNIVVIDKISKNKYNKKEYFGFSFVPLVKD